MHFVGLNASAATIELLGAVHISIDAGVMTLVHKCSMAFFEWGSSPQSTSKYPIWRSFSTFRLVF
ncbi:MAG: hypothetical protein HDS71_07700 [Bacteroidales bacterium]|nr:hypothetical protein [Bacteroidales bacterium]MBD5223910.1 hypothetical protein [Bacteroidales bacterium]